MASPNTDYKQICIDENNIPTIEGTTMKVVELVPAHFAHAWSPEELHFQYPHISLGKVYSALAYYWDHKDALDADLEQRDRKITQLRQQAPFSRIEQKLREHRRLS